ncbi:MAG: DUF2225 domain-containing protein [Eubacterium sp.]|nr:DUF2225 domain-containing protein [Eubacterium sp.]
MERRIIEMESREIEAEAPLLLHKKVECPICGMVFSGLTVKTGKVRRIGTEIDLRPLNKPLDSIKYGVYSCPQCGYSGLIRNYDKLTGAHKKLLLDSVAASFVPRDDVEEADAFSYDEAIKFHKLALVCSEAKRGRDSEKAYTCVLIAWLYRAKAQVIDRYTTDSDGNLLDWVDHDEKAKLVLECKAQEARFLKQARDGLVDAEAKESPPFCGLDIPTTEYMIGAISFLMNDLDMASQMVSRTMINRSANKKLKDRAYDLKEAIKARKEMEKEEVES